jgi:hypothetical protein
VKWSETLIARALALQTFNRKHLVVVPNCNWTGYECDLLVVTPDLRIIDVEVKISRADLKVDAKKYKWWESRFLGYGEGVVKEHAGRLVSRHRPALYEKTARKWPPKVWKHYYAMPAEIWTPSLLESINAQSGILLLKEQVAGGAAIAAYVERPAKPNRDAEKISPAAAIDIARLASLRMWESYKSLEDERSRRVDREKAAA